MTACQSAPSETKNLRIVVDVAASASDNETMPVATPKQVAYLTYMGVKDAAQMSKAEASEAINKLFDTNDLDLWDRLTDRQAEWITDRFVLYPKLYAAEIQRMLNDELPEMFHTFVRSRVVGASEKLTKAKIRQVVGALTDENAQWWQAKNKKEVFFARLTSMFPGCVDGRPPSVQTRNPTRRTLVTESVHESVVATKKRPSRLEILGIVLLILALIGALTRDNKSDVPEQNSPQAQPAKQSAQSGAPNKLDAPK